MAHPGHLPGSDPLEDLVPPVAAVPPADEQGRQHGQDAQDDVAEISGLHRDRPLDEQSGVSVGPARITVAVRDDALDRVTEGEATVESNICSEV